MEEKAQRSHRPARAGRKADKKKGPNKNAEKNNPKAFAFASGKKAEKAARRTMDLDQKKLHVPLVDRTPLEAPPIVVAVVGPPGTGKTTLIRSLVKRYTKHNLNEIKGPITVVSGKKRRLTFMECNNDLNSMIDVAKVADLVLLLIDASFGFEMETFEFLNILQVHGFPRVMGVLTHLDKFKNNKKQQKTKKRLKQRFWTEIYQGAKLFYLSGIINGKYPRREVLNLSRFISVMKFRPLIWRNTHPYLLCDRVEDLTDPEKIEQNAKCDRTVSLYGYVRGTNFKPSTKVHIPGAGDFSLTSVSTLTDPCPIPDKERKRRLDDRQKLLYAPMCDVGGVLYDKDAVYINVPGIYTKPDGDNQDEERDSESEEDNEDAEGERMVLDLQDAQATIQEKMQDSELRIFRDSAPIKAREVREMDANGRMRRKAMFGEDDDDEDEEEDDEEYGSEDELDEEEMDDEEEEDDEEDDYEDDENMVVDPTNAEEEYRRHGRRRAFTHISESQGDEKIEFAESDSDLGLSEDEAKECDPNAKWKENMLEKAAVSFTNRRRVNLMDLVYGNTNDVLASEESESGDDKSGSDDDDEEEEEELFQIRRQDKPKTISLKYFDSTRPEIREEDVEEWNEEEALQTIHSRFITGDATKKNANGEEEEVYGDFEDLETGETFNGDDGEEPTTLLNHEEEQDGQQQPADDEDAALQLARKKEQLKAKFDAQYDGEASDDETKGNLYDNIKESMARQAQLNREEFEDDDPHLRAQVEGYRPGMYVRIVIERMPCEFIETFDPHYPVLVGGLLASEETYGMVQVRLKRHRWYKKILKTNNPLIFSVGWRRFQTIPLFSLDDGTRNRMLKYTPEHMHCLATFYGPVTPPNTGFCTFQSVSDVTSAFRISSTGVVLDINRSSEIVKKLKLTGTPLKILKNTAFIKDMFTSALEVAKFEGASIRTVSGIRGTVKKAANKPEGSFRATFEDKILMSDIVFLRAWYPIKPKKFYNPITSLLLANKSTWQGMRSIGQIRFESNIEVPKKMDSDYKPIERQVRKFNPLKIPRALQAELPFASKPKLLKKQSRPGLLQRRPVILEPEETKVYRLMQQINTMKRDKDTKRKEKNQERREVYLKKKEREEENKLDRLKTKKRDFFKAMGLKSSGEGGPGKRSRS